MKTTGQTIPRLIPGCALGLSLMTIATAQLQFTSVNTTDEGAKRLAWQSESNTVYRIEYTDQLWDISQGGPVWQTLYDHYPSHGTNTFWLDTGDYFRDPPILHPKSAGLRFYRIVNEDTDTAPPPTVSITSPAGGATAFDGLTVTVSASTDQPFLTTKLYVDGEELPSSDDGTNFVINTCEWPNGPHVLFATAECLSSAPWPTFAGPVAIGHAVSPYVTVIFTNLITRVSFSEPFFNPDAGQTQQVSAVFSANVNWTLQIQDASSNTVRTATGTGASMSFDWDGNGDGGSSLPAGAYYYLISAQTNGQALALETPPPGGDGEAATAAGMSSSLAQPSSGSLYPASEAEALAAGLDYYYVPSPPLPPVWANGDWVPWTEVYGPVPPIRVQISPQTSALPTSGFSTQSALSADETSGDDPPPEDAAYGGPSSQSTRAPSRRPTAPMRGIVGMYGLAYQDYWPSGISLQAPFNGLPGYPTWPRVSLENQSPNYNWSFDYVGCMCTERDFTEQMKRGGWVAGFVKKNYDLQASDLRKASLGGANIFNTNGVSLGLLNLHGAYGTSPDYDQASGANAAEQIYFPIDGRPNGSPSWVRMSEMDLGSPGTNGLKWMALAACNSLRYDNWTSIRSAGWKPFNGNLHLLLGASSKMDDGGVKMWVKFMLGLDNQSARSIRLAWYNSGQWMFQPAPLYFTVAGYDDCKQDMLTGTNNVTPQGAVWCDPPQQVKY